MYEIDIYKKRSGKIPLREYLSKITKQSNESELSQINLSIELLKTYGFAINTVHKNAIRRINPDLWELRPGKHRVFFFSFIGNKIVLLHAFRKKSQKTPDIEVEKAMNEMKDYIRRHEDGTYI